MEITQWNGRGRKKEEKRGKRKAAAKRGKAVS